MDTTVSLNNDVSEKSRFVRLVQIVFLLLVLSLGFMQPNMRIYIIRAQFTEAVFIILFVLFTAAILTKKIRPLWDTAYYFFGIYFAALFLSAIFSVSPKFSLLKLSGEAFLIGLAVLAHQIIRSEKMLKRSVLAWIAAGTFVSLVGTITVLIFYIDRSNIWHTFFLHHYGSLPPGNYPRVQSTFLYPAMLCSYLGISTMLLLAACKIKWIGKKIFWPAMLLHLTTIFFTVSPGIGGVLFGLSAWGAVWFAQNGKKAVSKLLLASGGLAAAAFLVASAVTLRHIPTSPYSFDILGTRIDPTQRLLAWQGAFDTFMADPFFGNGLGLGVCKVLFLAPSGQQQMLTDAHNIWLNVAGQAGIFGLLAIAAVTIYLCCRVWQIRPGEKNDVISALRIALCIAFISSVFIQGLTGSFENARHLWVMFGIILSLDILPQGSVTPSHYGN